MATLDDIVSVTIGLAAFSPSQKSFAIPLIAGFHTRFPELVRSYSSLDEMTVDGFTAEDAEYQVASKLLAQSPTVAQFKVGRLAGTQTVRAVTMLALAMNLTAYVVTINGRSYSFTSDASGTAAEIATGLAAAINADVTIPVTASVSTNNLVLTHDVAGPDFFVGVGNPALWASVNDTSAARTSLDADLTAIATADPNFYGLLLTRNSHVDALAAAAWVQTRQRVFATGAINYGSINSALDNLASNATSLGGVLKGLGRTRTALIFSPQDEDFPGAALLGQILPRTPGTYTAKFKSLAGVRARTLTTTEKNNLEANNTNHYQAVASVPVLQQGLMAAGKPNWIDTVILIDWLTARIKEEIFGAFVFNAKIPYTDEGIAVIDACVRKVLGAAETNGGIAEGWTVNVPRADDVSLVDKGNRFLDNVTFNATEAGAIHQVAIRGRLSP